MVLSRDLCKRPACGGGGGGGGGGDGGCSMCTQRRYKDRSGPRQSKSLSRASLPLGSQSASALPLQRSFAARSFVASFASVWQVGRQGAVLQAPPDTRLDFAMRSLMVVICLLAAARAAYCQPQDELYFRQPEKIVSARNEVGERLGNYAFTYETEGGILQRETGKRKYEGTDDETQLIQGSVQYNAPDGTPVAISWTADEYGARVSGTHLPTPPPIPPEIQRALDWLAKQPTTPEPDYDSPANPTTGTFKPALAAPASPTNKPVLINRQHLNKPPIPALHSRHHFF